MKTAEASQLFYCLRRTPFGPVAVLWSVITMDGLQVEYEDGFGLARASNTTPVLVMRFEADNAAALKRIQDDFRRVILEARPGSALPF